MRRFLSTLALAFAVNFPAEAADVEGTVIKNGGSCAVDGVCAFDLQTSGGAVRFIWGWEAPIAGCDPAEEAVLIASKLVPGQKVRVTVPDQFSTSSAGMQIYYLCQGSFVRAGKP
jgi:hypothetical protein